jgi:hypothetical protein
MVRSRRGPQPVDHRAGGELRECVGPQEGGKQVTHIRDRQPEFLADQRIGNRERRAIDVVDDPGNDQQSQRDALNRFQPWRRKLHSRHDSFSSPVILPHSIGV